MTDALDPAPIVDAAQHAAAAGDYGEAERLLRRALEIQEARLGSLHPDVASTLNNLALVCERTNKLDEAEHGFRRARAIAVASLPPGHPFIATSLQNLIDFCTAHGIPLWRPPAASADDQTSSKEEPEAEAQAVPMPQADAPRAAGTTRAYAVAALGVAVAVALAFFVQRRETADTSTSVPQAPSRPAFSDSPAAPASSPPPIAEPQPTVTPEKRVETPAPVERRNPPPTRSAAASVSVLSAQLCSALEKRGSPDWQCTSVESDPRPGTYIFYTRLLTNVDTTVEHHWYRGDRVQQVRRLRVTASPGTGYRTFSSNTISPERAGEWRVELRGADGAVLRDERIVIR